MSQKFGLWLQKSGFDESCLLKMADDRDSKSQKDLFSVATEPDRAALIERHGIEDRQLTQTATSREFSDKAADRAARQPAERTNEQERQRGQDSGREPSP